MIGSMTAPIAAALIRKDGVGRRFVAISHDQNRHLVVGEAALGIVAAALARLALQFSRALLRVAEVRLVGFDGALNLVGLQ
jgi:hypothetical protein